VVGSLSTSPGSLSRQVGLALSSRLPLLRRVVGYDNWEVVERRGGGRGGKGKRGRTGWEGCGGVVGRGGGVWMGHEKSLGMGRGGGGVG